MKEQVTDISKVLQDMTEEMRLMRETVNQQYAEIVKLNRNIDAQNLQIRKKDKEIEKLLERLSKYENTDKNSNNSSTPPSKERMKDEIVRRTRTLRKPSGKKPGGQNGHEGHKLSCSSTPDVVIDDIPSYCTHCGESLADAERVLDYVTQVVSIPELKPVIKEIRHYVMVCKNCGENYHVKNIPPKVAGKCDKCGGELYQRADDKEETILNRIKVYENTVPGIISYYEDKGILRTVSGDFDVDEAHDYLSKLFVKENLK
jgi:adenylate kinase family enzyme